MNIKIADRLVELRKKNGYSQEQLAEKLGLSRQAVSKWERAEASPDTDNLICLAKLYNVSLDDLLDTDQSIEEIATETKEKEEEKEDDEKISKLVEKLEEKEDEEDDDPDDKMTHTQRVITSVISGVTCFGVLITYILLGCFVPTAWGKAWPIFFLIAIIPSIFEAIFTKRFKGFLYPVFIAGLYCILGTLCNLWHPFWFLFLTIPVYYIIFDPIDKAIHKEDK